VGQAQKNELTIIEAQNKRDFASAPDIQFAPLGAYAESKDAGPEFTSLKKITRFKKLFSFEHAVKHYGKKWGKGKCITAGGSYNGRHELEPTPFIEYVDEIDLNQYVSIGQVTVKANPKYTKKMITSFVVWQKVVLSSALMQGTKVMLMEEGYTTKAENDGWGVGTTISGGGIGEDGDRGKNYSMSGGTGYSKGGAWLRTLPWITVEVFKNKE